MPQRTSTAFLAERLHAANRSLLNQDVDLAFADDLLNGGYEIGDFLYRKSFWGDGQPLSPDQLRRKVYHLVATSKLPTFKLGGKICARKSILMKWIKDQEDRVAVIKTGTIKKEVPKTSATNQTHATFPDFSQGTKE